MSKPATAAQRELDNCRRFTRIDATEALAQALRNYFVSYKVTASDTRRGELRIEHPIYGNWTIRLGVTPTPDEEATK